MSGIFTSYNGLKITSFGEELASEKKKSTYNLPTPTTYRVKQARTVKVCSRGSGGVSVVAAHKRSGDLGGGDGNGTAI